jgi:hypothetical protein
MAPFFLDGDGRALPVSPASSGVLSPEPVSVAQEDGRLAPEEVWSQTILPLLAWFPEHEGLGAGVVRRVGF